MKNKNLIVISTTSFNIVNVHYKYIIHLYKAIVTKSVEHKKNQRNPRLTLILHENVKIQGTIKFGAHKTKKRATPNTSSQQGLLPASVILKMIIIQQNSSLVRICLRRAGNLNFI